MKYPAMQKRARKAVVTPDFAGGLNLRDSVSGINDNQLTDCVNMWYKDGALRTRPGFYQYLNEIIDAEVQWNPEFITQTLHHKAHNITRIIGGVLYQLVSVCRSLYDGEVYDNSPLETSLYFFWVSEDECIVGKKIFMEYIALEDGYFVTEKDGILYVFCSNCVIYKLEDMHGYWEEVAEKDMYIPTVATNCMVSNLSTAGFTGDMLESDNLIGCYHTMVYSSVNPNHPEMTSKTSDGTLEGTGQLHEMTYLNIGDISTSQLSDYAGMTVTATLTNPSDGSVCTHTVTLDEDGFGIEEIIINGEKHPNNDGLLISATAAGVTFFYDVDFYNVAKVYKDALYKHNNLEITFPVIRTAEQKEKEFKKIFSATRNTWFGGGAKGLAGGSRLFLCGNTTEPNLVVWSGLDDPLYWPENNYFYVGDSFQAVTAFGKQSDMLVIFKEFETYYTRYAQNNDIDAQDLIDQTVVDYHASAVYFPLTQINPSVGCNCPDTIQLCRNRLVWATDAGKVYTLVSTDQYNERSIFEVGEMVHNRLREESGLKKAVSCDWEDHYLLAVDNRVYVMDYNSNGYQYAYSYQKNEDANIRIPWYYWELPENIKNIAQVSSNTLSYALLPATKKLLFVCGKSEGFSYRFYSCVINKKNKDDSVPGHCPISTMLQTKIFDFGVPGYYKNVDSVDLSLSNNGGVPIQVSFVTDAGTDEHILTMDGAETQPFSPGYIQSRTLHPYIRSVQRFGVRMTCPGQLVIEGMTLTYRILGGVR